MYLSHFHLNLKPFQINTDQRFLYLSEQHKEALAVLHYGIQDDRGVLVLTGDVGTGKTILVQTLVETLGPEVHTAVISDPSLRGLDFLNFMAHAFCMQTDFKTKGEFLISFSNFLDSLFAANQQALLILDEAQYIDPIQLEEIRILSDLERENNKRLNIFFVGQDEFDLMLADTRLRALKQRITIHYHLEPLTLKETSAYVRYRLKVAGCDRPLFTPSALKTIFGLTNGYPRLINIICDHCLLLTFVKDLYEIDSAIVKECGADLMHPSQLNQETLSPLENKPRIANTPEADIQPSAVPKTLPVVTTQTTKQVEPPERPKPLAILLQTFLRKPAYLFAVAVLLPALVWFNFRDDQNPNRQASSLSPKFPQEKQTKADVKPIPSSAPNKRLGAPQMGPVQIQGPSDSVYKIPTEQQLMNTAAVPPDQSASPMAVPPTVRPEEIAAPPMESSPDAPTVELLAADSPEDVGQPKNILSQEFSLSTHHDRPLTSIAENNLKRSADQSPSTAAARHNFSKLKPLVVERPINTDPATLEKRYKENAEHPSPTLKPDEIAASDEKAEAAEIVSDASPLSTAPVTSETDAPPVFSEKKGGTESVATEVTSTLPATTSTPVEAPSEIKLDQAIKSDFVDAPSPSASDIDASTARVDEQPQGLAVTPLPATTLAKPTAGELQFQETESDPSAIIDFVIRKRSQQPGNQ